MAKSLTTANCVFMLAITDLFDAPQQLQGFSADNVFDMDARAVTEAIMGVDGIQSAGVVRNPTLQHIVLQADSDSNAIFDEWVNAMSIAGGDVYWAQATVQLSGLQTKWTCTNGVLTMYPPSPNAAKIAQPRHYTMSWESVVPQVI